jgi:HlyD family secretion protein
LADQSTSTKPDLHALTRSRLGGESVSVPRPASRWLLRFALPMLIVVIALALLAYAARDALMPTIEVDVVPVVARQIAVNDRAILDTPGQEREPTVIAQAPGWIEPDPFAITVQAMISGVVEEVLVLEGDRVERGQTVARLVAADAELALRRARAELLEHEAAVERAKADVAAAESRLAEIDDEVTRKRELIEAGVISSGEFARLEHRLRSAQSDIDAARAAVRQHEAAMERQQVAVDEAALMLERTVIRAPVDGVVMARSVVPGTRIAIAGDGPGEQHFPGIVRLYDPSRLQVRADVSLTDAAKVGLGTKARITTEALPDRIFTGQVTRILHQADIQRNTVQVKVRVDDPSPMLKPDMLARVRFVAGASIEEELAGTQHAASAAESLEVFAPVLALMQRDRDRATVWVIEPGRDGRFHHAAQREIALGHENDGVILVRSGLRPGDRLIINPPETIRPGSRVRIRQGNPARANAETEDS